MVIAGERRFYIIVLTAGLNAIQEVRQLEFMFRIGEKTWVWRANSCIHMSKTIKKIVIFEYKKSKIDGGTFDMTQYSPKVYHELSPYGRVT